MIRPLALTLALVLIVAGCGTDTSDSLVPTPTSAPTASTDTPAILAAAALHLATDANTFGPGHRFSQLFVVERVRGDAGNLYSAPRPVAPLTVAEKTAIEAVLAPLSPVSFGDAADEWRTDQLEFVDPDAAILILSPPEVIDETTAHVSSHIWCGGVCGFWATFVVELIDGQWTVTGVDGPTAIS